VWTTHENAILDDNVADNDILLESNVESITTETTTDSNKEYKRPMYAAMTKISNKIILCPKLKKKVEGVFYVKSAFLLMDYQV